MARKDYRGVRKKTEYSIRFSMCIAFPCAVGMAVLGNPIISMIFGPDATAGRMMQIGAVSIIFYSLSTITNSVLQGIDQMRIPVIHAGLSVIVHIAMLVMMLTVFDMSIDAVVYADAFFALFICILNAFAIRRYLRYRQEIVKTFLLPGVCAALMGAATWLVYQLMMMLSHSNVVSVLVSMLVAVGVYGLSLVLLHVVNEEELLAVPKGAMLVKILKKLRLM